MEKRYWKPGFAVGGLGALFAFALKNDDSVFGFVRLRPPGLILLAMGALILPWGVLEWRQVHAPRPARDAGRGSISYANAIKSVGGLVAVVIGVGTVGALTIVALTAVAGLDDTSTVAIATSAFGVISAVVGSFMGLKIGTDQTGEAVDDAKVAAAGLGAAFATMAPEQRAQAKQDVADATELARSASSREH